MRRIGMMLVLLTACVGQTAAQKVKVDKEAAKIMGVNTASATAQEYLYKGYADSIQGDKIISMADASIRYMEKMAQMAERERHIFNRNSKVYKQLVKESLGFAEDLSDIIEYTATNPKIVFNAVNNLSLIVNLYDLFDQAKSVVKHAVVVGMSGDVPLPWNIKLKDFLSGKDKTLAFNQSSEKTEKDSDGDNLLTADERYRIVNNAVYQLRQMRRSLRVVYYKLSVELAWREKLKGAVNYAKKFHDDWVWAFKHMDNPFASYPRL